MIFCYKGEHFNSRRRIFISDYVITHGCFATYRKNKVLSPNTPSAIDKSMVISYKKMMNEYLERTRIAHNCTSTCRYSLSISNQTIKPIIDSFLNYGFNNELGYIDTTGTASGSNSQSVKEKALLELLEKNEAMIFWFKGLGKVMKGSIELEQLIDSIGFDSDEVLIYSTNNIINIKTLIVILINKGKVVATGVSCHTNEFKALINALREAKLIESIHMDERLNLYDRLLSEKEHFEIIKYLEEITLKMDKFTINDLNQNDKKIILPEWLKDVNYVVLNNNEYQDFITIRCYSRDLFNCVSQKKRISMQNTKMVLRIFSITESELALKPECIII